MSPSALHTIITRAGYKVPVSEGSLKDNVARSLLENLNCAVCYNVFQRGTVHRPTSRDGRIVVPVFTNAHVICKSCCQFGSCPLCKRKITAENLTGYDQMLNEPIDRLKVHYPSKKCKFKTELLSIDAHINKNHTLEELQKHKDPAQKSPTCCENIHRRLNQLAPNIDDICKITFTLMSLLILTCMFIQIIYSENPDSNKDNAHQQILLQILTRFVDCVEHNIASDHFLFSDCLTVVMQSVDSFQNSDSGSGLDL